MDPGAGSGSGVSYAGVALNTVTREAAEWVERNISLRDVLDVRPAYGRGQGRSYSHLTSQFFGVASDYWSPFLASWFPFYAFGYYYSQYQISFIAARNTRPTHHDFAYLPDRPVKLGSLWWPADASRWAVGHFLVSKRRLSAILPRCFRRVPGDPRRGPGFRPVAQPLVLRGSRPADAVGALLYMLPPRPLTALGNRLYLLTLVDDRFWWPVREHFPHTSDDDLTIDWEENFYCYQLRRFAGKVAGDDRLLFFEPADPDYHDTAETGNAGLFPAAPDALAKSMGARVVRAGDGRLTNMGVRTSMGRLAENLRTFGGRLRAGGQVTGLGTATALVGDPQFPFRPPLSHGQVLTGPESSAVLPSKFRFFFHNFNEGAPLGILPGSAGVVTIPEATAFTEVVVRLEDVAPGLAGNGQEISTVDHFIAHWVYVFDPAQPVPAPAGEPQRLLGTLVNGLSVGRLAQQIARDYVASVLAPPDAVFTGVVPWSLEGLSDAVEWTWTEWDVSTRVHRPGYSAAFTPAHHLGGHREPKTEEYLAYYTLYVNTARQASVGFPAFLSTRVLVDACATYVQVAGETVVKDIRFITRDTTIPTSLLGCGTGLIAPSSVVGDAACLFADQTCLQMDLPTTLQMVVLDAAGDCACVLGASYCVAWRRGANPGVGAWGVSMFFSRCGPAGVAVALPKDRPLAGQLTGGVNYLQIDLVCNGAELGFTTSGCNGFPAGEPLIHLPAVLLGDAETAFYAESPLIPVGDCCKGPLSTTTDNNFIKVAFFVPPT